MDERYRVEVLALAGDAITLEILQVDPQATDLRWLDATRARPTDLATLVARALADAGDGGAMRRGLSESGDVSELVEVRVVSARTLSLLVLSERGGDELAALAAKTGWLELDPEFRARVGDPTDPLDREHREAHRNFLDELIVHVVVQDERLAAHVSVGQSWTTAAYG